MCVLESVTAKVLLEKLVDSKDKKKVELDLLTEQRFLTCLKKRKISGKRPYFLPPNLILKQKICLRLIKRMARSLKCKREEKSRA